MSNARSRIPQPVNEPVWQYAPGSAEKKQIKEALADLNRHPIEIPVVIGGKRLTSGTRVPVVSPQKKHQVIAQVHQASQDDIQAAIQSCLDARKAWAALPWEDRASVFLKAADLISTKYRAKVNAATMLGQGKTVFQAEIDAVCELSDFFRFNAKYMESIYSEQPMYSPSGMWNRTQARGLEGFVFAITPFNFTAIALNLPASPAMMGCSVLWKPAPTSMLSNWICYEILEEAGLPPGVINFVPGEPSMVGSTALNHPELSGVHFTGSTATFNYIWETVGKNISKYNYYPRVVGESGGKDFIFAHPSADKDQLCTAMIRGAFEYQGQKCSAASRAYIPKSLWDGGLKRDLCQITNEIKMGDVEDFTNFMGAVIDERAFAKITGYIDRAKKASDAQVICGGDYDDSTGYFVRPTVIETSNSRYESMTEEIFGPVLTVYVYDDAEVDKALEECDTSTQYGLTGAIFATDRHAICELTKRLEHAAGNFYINDKPTGAVVGQQPFGGSRASGTNDKAGSILNLWRWTSMRTIKETFVPITDYRYPHMGES